MKQDLSDYGRGAAVATALVNTSARVREAGEQLDGPAALARFLDEQSLRPDVGRGLDAADVRDVRELRSRLRALLETADVERMVAGANELVARAGTAPSMERDDGGAWQWVVCAGDDLPLADRLAAVVGIGVLGTVRVLGPERVRSCADPTCGGMFVDTSRAGRRRYCTPELCGNRVNVARFRERRGGG